MDNMDIEKVGLVIVAGGGGTRMGDGPAKQYRKLFDTPILIHTVRAFYIHDCITHCVVVVPKDDMESVKKLFSEEKSPWQIEFVAGGNRRQDSVMNGIRALQDRAKYAAIHDGARPFPPLDFAAAVELAKRNGAMIYATPLTDTLKKVSNQIVDSTLPRENLWKAQTPQIFELDLLINALEHCDKQQLEITDDASAVEQYGQQVAILCGSQFNLKITVPDDMILAEAIAERILR